MSHAPPPETSPHPHGSHSEAVEGDGDSHAHGPFGHSGHSHAGPEVSTPRVIWALIINVGITLSELIAGLITGSLALLSDALHNFSDVVALAITYIGARVADRKPDAQHTYGLGRAEVLAGLINALALVGITVFILYEAYERVIHPQKIGGGVMLAVGFIGLVGNVASVVVLSYRKDKDRKLSLNLRSAVLHLLLDAFSAFGVMVAAAVILFTGWVYADPVASVLIAALVLVGSTRLVMEALGILMERVPSGVSVDTITQRLCRIEGIKEIHDLHVWSVSSTYRVLTAHFVVDPAVDKPTEDVVNEAQTVCSREFFIHHCTLQPEKLRCMGESKDYCVVNDTSSKTVGLRPRGEEEER